MSRNVRVVVASRPRLMRELILATIADQPDIDIVGEVQNEAEIGCVLEEKRPDFLIVARDSADEPSPLCRRLLWQFPDMKILALAPEQNHSMFLWASLDIHSDRIEASEEGILNALRSKAAGGHE